VIDAETVSVAGGGGVVPCCTIVDWPDFETRGLLHDVTRGKVPTLGTLKQLVDRLALLKINQLQLYFEHTFVFPFDEDICRPEDGLTPDEVRELEVYCRQRFVTLVPAVATFGHMGRILSMPRYRHLAEVEAARSWEEMTWPQRVRGLTLDCMNPDAHALVQRMWADVLEAFSAPAVNICGDEPWDLGFGKNKGRFDETSKGDAYIEQLCRTHDICASHGRRTQFWSDVIVNYPGRLGRLPRDGTVLHWGYHDQTDYQATRTFTETGLDTFVCPGTSGWKRILNAMDLAERNICEFARAGMKHGAKGLLNTDWGDHGHFNLLAGSWHAIVSGGALGWNVDHPVGDAFDASASRFIFGTSDGTGLSLLRAASQIAERCETWRLFWMPLRAVSTDTTLPSAEAAEEAREQAARFLRWVNGAEQEDYGDSRDLAELESAARFTALFADKVELVHQAGRSSDRSPPARQAHADLAERIQQAAGAYESCWRARNKETGLSDVLRALSGVVADLRGNPRDGGLAAQKRV
jgi:hypothetical protein